jgi:glycosyltransferase involved in cell wall biosynthesis
MLDQGGAEKRDDTRMDRVPDVSVVIPTRNRWEVLERRGLKSAMSQRGVVVEVIVVDDGSELAPTSDTLQDPRLKLVRHERRLGVAAARNTGVCHAQGEWIAFLDDDDMWAPEKLISLVRAMTEARADFGYSSALVLDLDLRPVEVARAVPPNHLLVDLRRGNFVPAGASNVVAKRSLLTATGGFDESFSAMSDWDMWFRLAQVGRPEAVDDVLIAYAEGSWLLHDEPLNRQDCERLTAKHPEVAIDWFGYRRWVADTCIRNGRRREAARRYLSAGLRYRHLRSLVLAGAALLGRGVVDRLRGARRPEVPEWLASYGVTTADSS